MEFLAICSTTQTIMANDVDWTHSESLSSNEVFTIYNYIRELTWTLELELGLYERTQKEIDKLLHSTSFKFKIFEQKSIRQ